MSQVSDDLYLGPVYLPGQRDLNAPSSPQLGAGPAGRIFYFDAVPVVSGPALLAAVQSTGAAGNLVLTPGAGVTSFVDPSGNTRLVLDYARRVTLTSAGNQSTVNFLVSGFDQYGQRMSQLVVGPNIATVTTLKAFKQITSVSANGAATAVSVGFSDAMGLPYRVIDAGYAIDPSWANVFARDGGTFVAADVTTPSTNLTGDVRGVYTPSTAAGAGKRLVFGIALTAIQCGPNATRIGLAGVDQS